MKNSYVCRPYGVSDSKQIDYSMFNCEDDWNVGLIWDINFWVECAHQWCYLNGELQWVDEMFERDYSDDEIIEAINKHWDLNIVKADKKEIAEYIKTNIFPKENNHFMNCHYIGA